MRRQRIIDGRELSPPEPLELTLQALELMPPDEDLLLLLYCEPLPLYSILERDGYAHSSSLRADGTREILIARRHSGRPADDS